MAYNEAPVFVDGERFTQNEANLYIFDNLEALKNPPTAVYVTTGHSSNYSTSSTSFVDVDSDNMALSIAVTGGVGGGVAPTFIGFCGTVYGNAQIYFRVLQNGNSVNEDDGAIVIEASGGGTRPASFLFAVNTSAGEFTYTLQWRVLSGTGELMANAGTSGRDCKAIFFVREMT